jgi:hypothetical protein
MVLRFRGDLVSHRHNEKRRRLKACEQREPDDES